MSTFRIHARKGRYIPRLADIAKYSASSADDDDPDTNPAPLDPPVCYYHTSVKHRLENQEKFVTDRKNLEPGQLIGKYIPAVERTWGKPEGLVFVDE
jgi:hypothetical protein